MHMPRRIAPDALALAVGKRVRELRHEEGLTLEQLADTSEIGSKGHVSNIERGLVRPNIHTLKRLADALNVLPLDLLTFPHKTIRERLVDLTRKITPKQVADVIRRCFKID
jgi:transcriptional regulator with XRE-family HTH domain